VKFDPKEAPNKYVEGTFFTDYFPYYYLAVAHLRLSHFDKAEEYLQLAAKDRINKLQPLIAAAENELAAARPKPQPQPANPLPNPAPPPPPKPNPTPPPAVNPPSNPVTPPATTTPPAPNPAPTKPAEPPKPAIDPKFEPMLRSAQTALDGKRYADAMQRFDELKGVDAAEFARRGLASRRSEAARGRVLELTQEGLAILREKDGKLADAKSKFQEAQRIQPSSGAADGLAEVVRREIAAEDEARRVADERQLYDTLIKRGGDFYREGKYAEAASALNDARRLDTTRFSADREIARINTDITARLSVAPPADFSVVPLQEALLEYLKGNVARTIALLEPPAQADNGTMDKRVRAPLHAYLAAAYADRALVSRSDDEKKKFEQQALAQFKVALDVAPDFQLSETAVSPAVRDFLKKAVGRRP